LPSNIVTNFRKSILDRFFRTEGHYTKKPLGAVTDAGVKETHSPAMDILVSSNFERLLWFFAFQTDKASTAEERRQHACESVSSWLNQLKTEGGFQVPAAVIEAAKAEFESERVSNEETILTIRDTYKTCFPTDLPAGSPKSSKTGGYILDPHTAVGVAASRRSIQRNPGDSHISLSTAHPAKFASAVDLALSNEDGYSFSEVLPEEFVGLEQRERRVTAVPAGSGWEGVREIVKAEVEQELEGLR
jgi:threonine synthase